jgi:hypothetical protein
MKKAERVALVYGVSLIGMGAVAYARGRRGMDLVTDGFLYGLVAGTAVNGAWFVASGEASSAVASIPNPFDGLPGLGAMFMGENPMGTLPRQAVNLLAAINQDELYAPKKAAGVTVGPVSGDPHMVNQDE